MRTKFIIAGGFEIAVYEWGERSDCAVFCVHGMGGQGQNFCATAEHLAGQHYVVAIDLIGRGRSQWGADAESAYNFECYSRIVEQVLDQLAVQMIHWIGVSMGGALGISMCADRLADRALSLVLNDIGPQLDEDVRKSICDAVSNVVSHEHFGQFVRDYEALFSRFGMKHSLRTSWLDMALKSSRRDSSGHWTFHYDPKVARQLDISRADFELSTEFESLRLPILLFRGGESAVLTQSIVSDMQKLQPRMKIVDVPNVGHAPLLDRDSDLKVIHRFVSNCASIGGAGAVL